MFVPNKIQCCLHHSPQEHRHSYVRKNAVFAVLTIYRDFESLIPDAAELIQIFLAAVSKVYIPRAIFLSQFFHRKATQLASAMRLSF